jgi:hypothetical protein
MKQYIVIFVCVLLSVAFGIGGFYLGDAAADKMTSAGIGVIAGLLSGSMLVVMVMYVTNDLINEMRDYINSLTRFM